MEKKILLFVSSIVLCLTLSSYKTNSGDPETFVLNYIPPVTGNQPNPRSPAAPIYIVLNGHTVSFSQSFIGCLVSLTDVENETAVLSDYVNCDGNIEIPDSMTGTYMLTLCVNDSIYAGEIELSNQ